MPPPNLAQLSGFYSSWDHLLIRPDYPSSAVLPWYVWPIGERGGERRERERVRLLSTSSPPSSPPPPSLLFFRPTPPLNECGGERPSIKGTPRANIGFLVKDEIGERGQHPSSSSRVCLCLSLSRGGAKGGGGGERGEEGSNMLLRHFAVKVLSFLYLKLLVAESKEVVNPEKLSLCKRSTC